MRAMIAAQAPLAAECLEKRRKKLEWKVKSEKVSVAGSNKFDEVVISPLLKSP